MIGSRTYIFTAIVTCLVLLFVEFTAYVFYVVQYSSFNFDRYEEQLGKAEGRFGSSKISVVESQGALHPYLGYTPNPDVLTAKDQGGVNISDYGFIDDFSPIRMRESNEVLIGISGGSVAAWFFIESRDVLESYLRKSPIFKSKKITFINMAAGGWKQPQQLLSFTYLLSLGANFDIIINIDGFNDLVLPIYYNRPKSVFPFYPTNWYVVSQTTNSGFIDPIINKVKLLDNERKVVGDFIKNSFLSENILARVIWLNYDRYRERQTNNLREKYYKQNVPKSSYVTSGPKYTWSGDKKNQYQDMASYWAQSSKQMRLLANSNNIKYYHFLQPNQYVNGSKSLSKDELERAFLPNEQFGQIVKGGYSALQKEGARLKHTGENFYDLTYIFKDNHETLYIDPCCHFNKAGLGIMAEKIADVLIDSY